MCSSRAPQSKYTPPRPFAWLVWQVPPDPQHPVPAQHVAPQACGFDATHWHAPSLQIASAGHARPQLPQLCGSFRVSTQRAEAPIPQTTSPAAQQRPLAHVRPVAQRVPHEPQFCGSVARSTQAVGLPAGHLSGRLAGQAQTLPAQISFASGHAALQPPQCRGSVAVFTHAPLHSCGREGGQAQAPPEQIWFVIVHFCPQPPQLAGSLRTSVQNAPQSSGFGS